MRLSFYSSLFLLFSTQIITASNEQISAELRFSDDVRTQVQEMDDNEKKILKEWLDLQIKQRQSGYSGSKQLELLGFATGRGIIWGMRPDKLAERKMIPPKSKIPKPSRLLPHILKQRTPDELAEREERDFDDTPTKPSRIPLPHIPKQLTPDELAKREEKISAGKQLLITSRAKREKQKSETQSALALQKESD